MNPSVSQRSADDVRDMFTRIAPRYDFLNRLMTFGQDRSWRRETIQHLDVQPGDRLLDIGTGTGDLAFEALQQTADILVVAVDFTPQMIRIGKERAGGHQLMWVIADAHHLPFTDSTFNAVVSGFLFRNVVDLDGALREQARTLQENGRMASVDTTPLSAGAGRPLFEFFLHSVIPLLGNAISGDPDAYHYLPRTTERFLPAEALAKRLKAAGFDGIHFIRRIFGTIALHWAKKPPAVHQARIQGSVRVLNEAVKPESLAGRGKIKTWN